HRGERRRSHLGRLAHPQRAGARYRARLARPCRRSPRGPYGRGLRRFGDRRIVGHSRRPMSQAEPSGRAAMIAVIFEVWPADGRKQTYLDIAAELRPELEQIDGFLSIERFQSLVDETKILSLSFWRDEAAVASWRNTEHHRSAQKAGRGGVFRDYRLRVT